MNSFHLDTSSDRVCLAWILLSWTPQLLSSLQGGGDCQPNPSQVYRNNNTNNNVEKRMAPENVNCSASNLLFNIVLAASVLPLLLSSVVVTVLQRNVSFQPLHSGHDKEEWPTNYNYYKVPLTGARRVNNLGFIAAVFTRGAGWTRDLIVIYDVWRSLPENKTNFKLLCINIAFGARSVLGHKFRSFSCWSGEGLHFSNNINSCLPPLFAHGDEVEVAPVLRVLRI